MANEKRTDAPRTLPRLSRQHTIPSSHGVRMNRPTDGTGETLYDLPGDRGITDRGEGLYNVNKTGDGGGKTRDRPKYREDLRATPVPRSVSPTPVYPPPYDVKIEKLENSRPSPHDRIDSRAPVPILSGHFSGGGNKSYSRARKVEIANAKQQQMEDSMMNGGMKKRTIRITTPHESIEISRTLIDERSPPHKSMDRPTTPRKLIAERTAPFTSMDRPTTPRKIDERTPPQKSMDRSTSPGTLIEERSAPFTSMHRRTTPYKSMDRSTPDSIEKPTTPRRWVDRSTTPHTFIEERAPQQSIERNHARVPRTSPAVAAVTQPPVYPYGPPSESEDSCKERILPNHFIPLVQEKRALYRQLRAARKLSRASRSDGSAKSVKSAFKSSSKKPQLKNARVSFDRTNVRDRPSNYVCGNPVYIKFPKKGKI
eukprot:GHVO01052143.1.p1 GENE.GHVO01052143.1~~GHVO01052143.1.p1  ORF type:complete len:426 (+),score=87.22 GHVO01052143.1:29-1306(+)